jgi:phosphocarrier protein FPr
MVGVVIVAHSAALAQAVLTLVEQIAQGEVPLAACGGIDDPQNPYGTDAMQVRDAIESIYGEDGVVVLMDMGSSLLSAEMAIEFLPENKRGAVRLCDAPLVEGAIAAAVCSKGGGSLDEVLNEARGALAGKAAHLGTETPGLGPQKPGARWGLLRAAPEAEIDMPRQPTAPVKAIERVINNRLGIHVRPAARFVTTATRFKSKIMVRNVTKGTEPVSARSINRIATLDVRRGHRINVTAEGPDAEEALTAMASLVESNFGEPESGTTTYSQESLAAAAGEENLRTGELNDSPPAPSTYPGEKFDGIPASPGIAIAPALQFRPSVTEIPARKVDDPQAEWLRLNRAIEAVKKRIHQMGVRIAQHTDDYQATLFDAHRLSLEDPALLEVARTSIFERTLNAEKAWQLALDDMILVYQNAESAYIQQRATDLGDLKSQVLQMLIGAPSRSFTFERKSILLAADFAPSDLARLEPDMVAGLCTVSGSPTSHSAILARSLDIPMAVGLGPDLFRVPDGATVVLDGKDGTLRVNPEHIESFRERQNTWLVSQQKVRQASQQPAVTRDGKQIGLLANINYTAEVAPALRKGAEGIGVFRTEFLFMERPSAPSEEEQLATYRSIAETLGKRPFIIRTLDAGGDKPIPYMDMPVEDNPFLGERGIRISLSNKDLFMTQLRAILRATPGHRVRVLLPMISSLDEVCLSKELIAEAEVELAREKQPFEETIAVGIMIEVPSAVAVADRLAREVDFFSIGSNDLGQYVMAADRTNPRLASLGHALHPAVLRMIRQTVKAGQEAGIPVALCGEVGAERVAVPILLGLGIDELSMGGSGIPAVKGVIAKLSLAQCQDLAHEALELNTSQEVRQLVKERLGETVEL